MAFLYPWGNTQQLNLDWILQKIKELETGGGADLDEVAEALLAASYSAQAYDRSDIVFHDGKLYRANQAIPAPGEAWTPAHWDEILLGDTVSNLVQYVAALSNDQIANSSSVSGDHTSDALDTLKNAIDAITLDSDSVSNESNVAGDNVSDALDNLNGAINTTQTDLAPILTSLVADTNLVAGDLRIYNNQLYRVTQDVSSGAALIVDTNISAINLTNINQTYANNTSGYCKMADGTLIQWGEITNVSVAMVAAGALYVYSNAAVTIQFPIPFVNAIRYQVSGAFQYSTGAAFPLCVAYNAKAASYCIPTLYDVVQRNGSEGRITWQAVGRWK